MDETVLCKDCIHSFYSPWYDRFVFRDDMKCKLNKTADNTSLVTGKVEKGYYRACSVTRINDMCGPDAKSWEPKDKKHFFVYLKRIKS